MKFAFNSLRWRIALALVIGFLLAWGTSEMAFVLLRDSSDHVPQTIALVIPAGTAERVARGEAVPSIPAEMVFVVGDTLVVKNEDNVSHQLGPVWVPAGTSASLTLDTAAKYAYACTFEPSRYLGLDVRERVTTKTRLQAMILIGPPSAALIVLYSLVLWPLSRTPSPVVESSTTGEGAGG